MRKQLYILLYINLMSELGLHQHLCCSAHCVISPLLVLILPKEVSMPCHNWFKCKALYILHLNSVKKKQYQEMLFSKTSKINLLHQETRGGSRFEFGILPQCISFTGFRMYYLYLFRARRVLGSSEPIINELDSLLHETGLGETCCQTEMNSSFLFW